MTDRARLRKTKDPCPGCRLHRSRCICAEIPTLNLSTRVVLLVHAKELKRTTNTGTLALKALANSEMVVRGEGRERLDLSPIFTGGYETLLLFPGEGSVDIREFKRSAKPIQLIVPDGNWRQASKVSTRHPELAQVQRVFVSAPWAPESARMRHEPVIGGMATLEAIAHALGCLEGQRVGDQLLKLYGAKLSQTLRGRGLKMEKE